MPMGRIQPSSSSPWGRSGLMFSGGQPRLHPAVGLPAAGASSQKAEDIATFDHRKTPPPTDAPSTPPAGKTIQPGLFNPPANPFDPANRRFAVIGDTGTGLDNQYDVARQMNAAYGKKPFASVLMLGDNVYDNGEPHWFEDALYTPYKDLYQAGVKFFPVLGNHDVRLGYGDAQLRYMGVPAFYQMTLGSGANTVDCFAIDTTLMIPGYDKAHVDNPTLALAQAQTQLTWLEQALAKSTAKYKIVYGHYPLYSSGMHARKPEFAQILRNALEPLFVRHGVDLYLAGHEHHYERTQPIQGVTHIVSGGGGDRRRIFYNKVAPYDGRVTAQPESHFMTFEITDQGLAFEAINDQGQVIDQGLIQKPQPAAADQRQRA